MWWFFKMTSHNDLTKDQYEKKAEELFIAFPGSKIFQKFTCGNCGSRQTVDEPNIWYTSATCEECGYLNIIDKAGMLLATTTLYYRKGIE